MSDLIGELTLEYSFQEDWEKLAVGEKIYVLAKVKAKNPRSFTAVDHRLLASVIKDGHRAVRFENQGPNKHENWGINLLLNTIVKAVNLAQVILKNMEGGDHPEYKYTPTAAGYGTLHIKYKLLNWSALNIGEMTPISAEVKDQCTDLTFDGVLDYIEKNAFGVNMRRIGKYEHSDQGINLVMDAIVKNINKEFSEQRSEYERKNPENFK